MPGPVSDSYDPEFGTGHNCHRIREELQVVYDALSNIIEQRPPMFILDLIDSDLPQRIQADLPERTWRIIRFALERAKDSI